jgi:hypothetical protein
MYQLRLSYRLFVTAKLTLGAELAGQAALRGLDNDGGVGDPSPRGLRVLSHGAAALSVLFSGE